jgi:hypothetical protein
MHIVLSHKYDEVFQFTKQFHPTYFGVKKIRGPSRTGRRFSVEKKRLLVNFD